MLWESKKICIGNIFCPYFSVSAWHPQKPHVTEKIHGLFPTALKQETAKSKGYSWHKSVEYALGRPYVQYVHNTQIDTASGALQGAKLSTMQMPRLLPLCSCFVTSYLLCNRCNTAALSFCPLLKAAQHHAKEHQHKFTKNYARSRTLMYKPKSIRTVGTYFANAPVLNWKFQHHKTCHTSSW